VRAARGLRGRAARADKNAALAAAAINPGRYFTITTDLVLEELARRSLMPVVPGLSPMEGADLVHTEAQHIAKRLTARAIADGRNLLLDVTMGSEPSVHSWLVNLGLAVYSVDVVIAAIDSEDAVRWAEEQHRQGHDQYVRGCGNGGRFVPADAIRVAAMIAAALARSDWTTILGHVASQQDIAFPAGELLTLAEAYHDGRITLADLRQQLRSQELASVPPVCPPGLQDAKPALDDLEPWAASSFEEIVVATDLDILTDDDYADLVEAITP
jgi:Zeta toxin